MSEINKYEIIKSLVDHHGNKNRAAVQLGYTPRHINRLIAKYNKEGKLAFVHGNKGRTPAHAISADMKTQAISLYKDKYPDTTFSYACELLEENDGISLSPTTLSKILYGEFIASPRTTKKTKRRMAATLRELKKASPSKKKLEAIHSSIVALEEAHPRRPRCASFGEMLQMDASVHEWFGGIKSHLHIAIDDATSTITGAYFDDQETLNGYYHVFHKVLTNYGIPAMFYTDRRTVFEYKKKNTDNVESDTFTQFSYACHQLGVEIKTTSVAQAKGRVERAFQTLQQRLPIALRLAGIKSLSEANAFLDSQIQKHNAKYSLPINHNKSVFIPQPDIETINQTLAVLTERTVDTGHSIRFGNQYYKTMDTQGLQVHYQKGSKGLVIKTFDGQLLFSIKEKIYALDAIPDHERTSRNFDFNTCIEEPVKRSIPSAKHPWRNDAFLKYRDHKVTEAMLAC